VGIYTPEMSSDQLKTYLERDLANELDWLAAGLFQRLSDGAHSCVSDSLAAVSTCRRFVTHKANNAASATPISATNM
jgi:hypothetical protein